MSEQTLIFGSGSLARRTAQELVEHGLSVIVATTAPSGVAAWAEKFDVGRNRTVEVLPVDGVRACKGSAGRYTLLLSSGEKTVQRVVSTIVLATDAVREQNFSLYGLTPCDRVVSLSQAAAFAASESGASAALAGARKTVLITGLGSESSPFITGEVMQTALSLQRSFKQQTYILTGNLKVAGHGLEALYRETKKAGTIYVKFTQTLPEFNQTGQGQVSITFIDEVTREVFRLTPDVTVVDEAVIPSRDTGDIARALGIDVGPDGFIQSDNVHRIPVATNRRGIFVTGSERGVQFPGAFATDALNAAHAAVKAGATGQEDPLEKAQIRTGRCVRCLTCYRICPYRAIELNTRPVVAPLSCEGCGICVAECPCAAITIGNPVHGRILEQIGHRGPVADDGSFKPAIMAFCCARSAAGAWGLAACTGYRLPEGLQVVSVPCGGGVSVAHLLTALQKGFDGVLVLTCHTGNCHSEHGNDHAGQRVARAGDALRQMGMEPGRLALKTLASNMGGGFAETVNEFEQALMALGPNKLKKP